MRESALNLSPEIREHQRNRYNELKKLRVEPRMVHISKWYVSEWKIEQVDDEEGGERRTFLGYKPHHDTLFLKNKAHKAAIREDRVRNKR